MSAINVLSLPSIFTIPQTCCECVCERPDTHVPVMRVPVVSAHWTVEVNDDGTRRLVERWRTEQRTEDEMANWKQGRAGAPACHRAP